jgi:serine/threonine-protein kinase
MSGSAEDSGAYPWELKPGTRVGRWRILEHLGTGSYGAVYRAESEDAPGKTYALKISLRPSYTRAEREVALLARTEHPNVVRVHDWGTLRTTLGNHLYFVMDWVQGLPLHTWAETTNPSVRELARVASTLALTLDWLHEQGVRHRDLKPEHILIRSSDSRPILIDFGVGHQQGASTLTSSVVPPGTVHLRTPEAIDFHRIHFRDADARYSFQPSDDLYALGVCLFRALTGHYPFSPELPSDMLALAILLRVPPPVSLFNPRVPPALSGIVARLLEKRPQARHASGRELHEALEAALAIGPAQAWEERVFAWEQGSDQAGSLARRTVRPEWPEEPPTASRIQVVVTQGAPGTAPRVGAMLMPPPTLDDPHLKRAPEGRPPPPPPRPSEVKPVRRVPRPRLGLVVALVALLLLGLVALLAAHGKEEAVPPAEAPAGTAPGARPPGDADARAGEPPGGPREPGAAAVTTLVEQPASADAASMTQPKDTSEVKTSTPSTAGAQRRSKAPTAVRGAVVAACVGAACAGSQQPGPSGALAALRKPLPPPEECPRGALEAMKELQIGKAGTAAPDGSIVPYETPVEVPLREGPVVFSLDQPLGTLPRYGTTVIGSLYFAGGRIHGRFTEARTRDGRRFPVCMVLLTDEREWGLDPLGAGEEPGTVLARPVAKVGWVERFQ